MDALARRTCTVWVLLPCKCLLCAAAAVIDGYPNRPIMDFMEALMLRQSTGGDEHDEHYGSPQRNGFRIRYVGKSGLASGVGYSVDK